MPFSIVRQDITRMKVDAIVNAANVQLAMGGGVCGAIFRAAGQKEMARACNELAPIKTGDAVITPGFALDAKYVIHAAGPIYNQWPPLESERLLRSAYLNSLELAKSYKCESIAFPLISSGIYGYPKEEALEVATRAIRDFLESNEMNVFLAVFDPAAFAVSQKLMNEVENYLDEHFVSTIMAEESGRHLDRVSDFGIHHVIAEKETSMFPYAKESLDVLVGNLDEAFADTLFRLIDIKGKTDPEVYKKANIDRKLFSKIRTQDGYTPSKRTILALAIALELDLSQTQDLLKRAGYTLSHSSKFDVIIEYFIVNKNFDIFKINEVLFKHDQPLLGA